MAKTIERMSLKSWEKGSKMAGDFMEKLGISERDSRSTAVWSNARKGYRITVVRMSDGMTMTGFVKA